jgi:hypothetical protein
MLQAQDHDNCNSIHVYILITMCIEHHSSVKTNLKAQPTSRSHVRRTLLVTRAARTRNRSLSTRELAIILVLRLSRRNIRARTQVGKRRLQARINHAQSSDQRRAFENIAQARRRISNDHLRNEASKTLRVLEVFHSIDETAADVAEIDAGEGVDFAGVAAD